jgi:dihydroorotate dehydrogenase (fumarate)
MKLEVRWMGLTLPHPFVPGASPLCDDLDSARRLEDAGAAALVMRSLFEEQLVQEQLHTHRYLDGHQHSHAEASSFLPQPDAFRIGPDDYLEHLRRLKAAVKVPVIASLNGVTPGGWLEHARLMEQAGADALELNVFHVAADPTESSLEVERRTLEMVRQVKRLVKIPFAVKLSPFYTALGHFADQLEAAGASGLVLFNRLFEPEIDAQTLEVRRVLRLSNSSELPMRLRWLGILSPHVKGSLACSGGVHDVLDAVRALMAGADVVQLVSVLLRHGPHRLTAIRDGLMAWMEEQQYESIDQLRGNMNLKKCPDPSAYLRGNYLHLLQSRIDD